MNSSVIDILKRTIHTVFRMYGFDIVRVHRNAPKSIVTGTFPPYQEYYSIGKVENYFIHDGYNHRSETKFFDDTENTDGWQKEVYFFAREIFDENNLTAVCDIGCGSGYKLVNNFGGCSTIGLDVDKTCITLKKIYPHLTWMVLDLNNPPNFRADLVIASDIIEHLLEPDKLLSYIAELNSKYILFSTVERNLLRVGTHNGPPMNPTHVREWNFAEFDAYISSRFEVLEHFISNSAQATQCLLCTPRRID